MSVDSNGEEISEHLCTPEIKELCEMFWEEKETEEEDVEDDDDFLNVCDNEEGQCYNEFYLAAERHDTETVRSLLMSSVDVNELYPNRRIRPQLYAIVKELLNKKPSVDHENSFHQTSLCMVPEISNSGIVHKLLKSSLDANEGNNDSCHTPLPIAPEMGCVEIAKVLIEYTGGINAVDENGDTALHLAARNDRNALVKILLKMLAERNVRSPLRLKALSHKLKLSRQPNKHKVDVGQITHHVVTHGDNFEIADTQLGCHLSVKSVSTVQATPLHVHLTAEREHAEIVQNLILNGANVNACNKDSMTPLHIACQNGHSHIVDILLDNHATVDLTKQTLKTPFFLAAKNGHADVVDVLLRRGICDFVAYSWKGTPLHVAVRQRHTKVVEVILKHNCRRFGELTKEQKFKENAEDSTETSGVMPVEFVKPDGRRVSAGIVWTEKSTPMEAMRAIDGDTALEIAVRSIQPKMVKILLSVDRYVYSEQHLGESFRCMIDTIIERDERCNSIYAKKCMNIIDVMEVLCYDIQREMKCKNIKEIARVLINSNKLNVNYQDEDLNTLLHEVILQCRNCSFNCLVKKSRRQFLQIQTLNDVLQLLLENGADFNMRNAYGETPLMIASHQGCSHAIQKVFDWEQKSGLKLDLDARDQYGATALIKAAELNNVSAMRLLLSHKVSVNLNGYYGFTALHAAVYQPNRIWFDLHFFCQWLLKRVPDRDEDFLEMKWEEKTVYLSEAIGILKFILDYDKRTTRIKEETVKLLLAIDDLNVNAIDFRGNTPLDLAVMSSRRINSETFKALKDRGAIRNSLKPVDEAPLEVARVDERGRGRLHRLIISHISYYAVENMKADKSQQDYRRLYLMLRAILLKPDNVRHLANATGDKGRTPLHYAVMTPSYNGELGRDLAMVILDMGSNVNSVDMYGKTPLHYTEMNDQYEILIELGSDENLKDKNGHTPKDLRQLRESVIINKGNAEKLSIEEKTLYTSTDIKSVLNSDHVTELSKRKFPVAFRIYSQSRRPEESSEEAIWKIWVENDFLSLNRRLGKLKPPIQRFIERLADGIKDKDQRFECQPLLVGSADEETKVVISADFDFNFKLVKFSQLCDVFPHPLGPKGYFQLKRKSDNATGKQDGWEFDCFFNLDQCLLTNEVNSRFQIILEDVFHDPNFWQDEHLFEWNFTVTDAGESRKPSYLCKNVRLKMINPIEDGEGGFIFVNLSIDVVACVQVEDSRFGDQLPVDDKNPAEKVNGCTFVFDQPRFDPSKPHRPHLNFSDTFSRISFAPVESRIIRESSSLIKAAYIVCKLILFHHQKTTYQLKTSLLFCMKVLKIREGCERKEEERITKTELAFWVERLMFCFMEFCRHDVYPCYFMTSFKQKVVQINKSYARLRDDDDISLKCIIPFKYSAIFDIYLDLCPDDTMINIPIFQNEYTNDSKEGSLIVNQDPKWEHFHREEFIGKLA